MTPQTKTRIRNWLITIGALLPAGGWGVSVADTRYVHQSVYERHLALDSLRRVEDSTFREKLLVKVDSTNLRLQQIRCGPSIANGCR